MWTSRHRTFDEWLDTPFVLTRCFVTLFGVLCVLVIAANAWSLISEAGEHLFPPAPPAPPTTTGPEEDPSVEVRTHCFVIQEPPILERLLSIALGVMPVWGTALVWRRPRAGFLLSGLGLAQILVAFRILILVAQGIDDAMEKCFNGYVDTLFLLVLLWLALAWWKVGGEPRRA